MAKWGVLTVLGAAQFLMVLDQAVMNVAISQLVEDFDTTVTTIQIVIAFYALVNPGLFAAPVYRFYRASQGTHAYALTEAERDALAASGATAEGIAYYVATTTEPGALVVHRFVNTPSGGELFTNVDDERDDVQRYFPQFAYRGVAFTAYPAAR